MPHKKAAWVRTGETTTVPSAFDARILLGPPELEITMAIVVGAGGHALVREFAVAPQGAGETVTTRLLRRIPMDRLLRAALQVVTVDQMIPRDDIHPDAFQMPGDPADQAWVSPRPQAGRGREVSSARVVRAAEIYREALASGSRKPAEVVAERLHYSRATAARDIRAARERGLLPGSGAPVPQSKVTPPSNEAVAADPIWRRFDDPTKWASMSDVMTGPSGLPVFDPTKTGTSAPSPTPVPRDPSEPDRWLERIQEAAAFHRENPDLNKPRPENESSTSDDAGAADGADQ